jgi:hypothetical protein
MRIFDEIRGTAGALATLGLLAVACGGRVVVDGDVGAGGAGGGGTSPPSGPSCETQNPIHVCYTYGNLNAGQTQAMESACTAAKGTLVSACPTAGALGSCKLTTGGVSLSATYYTGAGLSADAAKSSCEAAGGNWVPA